MGFYGVATSCFRVPCVLTERKNYMLKNLTVKTKLYIFLFLCLIGIATVTYNKVQQQKAENRKIEARNAVAAEKNKQIEEQNKKAQEEEKKEVEKKKQLEDKYIEAFNIFHSGMYSKAVAMADEIIALDSNYYKAYNIKGIALCYGKEYEEGMKNIDKALSIKGDYGYARFNKALAYELYGHYDDALQWYDKALEVENYVWSYYGKASIYGRKGDVANTVKYLKTAIDMDPNVKEEAKKEADFNNVRNSEEFQNLIK